MGRGGLGGPSPPGIGPAGPILKFSDLFPVDNVGPFERFAADDSSAHRLELVSTLLRAGILVENGKKKQKTQIENA